MPHPFIIWTFQRTGGTSLSEVLREAIAPKAIKQEPFNPDRDFGQITLSLRKEKFPAGVSILTAILETCISFKHCFELRSRRFNQMLLSALSANRNYRNILLLRNEEIDRVCSLYLAKQTSVWGKWKVERGGYDEILERSKKLRPFPIDEMVKHSLRCIGYRTWLLQQFADMNIEFIEVGYEEIYTGEEQDRIARTKQIFEYLDADFDPYNQAIQARIMSAKQGSDKLYSFVPNYEEARAALRSQLNNPAPDSRE